jgi:hypothetical protein
MSVYSTQIQWIAERTSTEDFTPEYIKPENQQDREENGLGIALANWAGWDGYKLLRVLGYALEDANFHSEYAKLQELYPLAFETP